MAARGWLPGVACLYFAVLAEWWAVAGQWRTHYLGLPVIDLYMERWLTADFYGQGHWLGSDTLNFPDGVSYLTLFLSYLHVAVAGLLPHLLGWPEWWNVAVMLPVVLSAVALAWTVADLTGDRTAATAAGLAFLLAPWPQALVERGHLCQLWLAPFLVALAWLDRVLRRPEDRRAPWLLAAWTVATALVYWIYGLLLALLGALRLLCEAPRMGRREWRRVLLAGAAASFVLGPVALHTVAQNSTLRPYLAPRLAESKAREDANRAILFSLELPYNRMVPPEPRSPVGWPVVPVAGARWVPLVPLAAGFFLLAGAWSRGGRCCYWLMASGLLLVLALGPYCRLGPGLLADEEGQLVALPFHHLTHGLPLAGRWQIPDRTVPLAVALACLLLGDLLAGARAHSRRRGGAMLAALALLALNLASLGALDRPDMPLSPAEVPRFCRYLSSAPPGALLEMPLGYSNVAYSLQPFHGHPTTQWLAPLPSLVGVNQFALWLYQLNLEVAPPRRGTGLPQGVDLLGAGVPYGAYPAGPAPGRCRRAREEGSSPCLLHAHLDPGRVLTDRTALYDSGVRYVVLHREGCHWMDPERGEEVYRSMRGILRRTLGESQYSDTQVSVYSLSPAAGPSACTPRPACQPPAPPPPADPEAPPALPRAHPGRGILSADSSS